MTEQELDGLKGTLRDIGFEPDKIDTYVHLMADGDHTGAQRMLMLGEKRREMLDEIHFWEKQLDRLDYLRHTLRKSQAAQI